MTVIVKPARRSATAAPTGKRSGAEWPTLGLACLIYGSWLALTWWHAALPWPALLVAGGWICAWQSSLQHELVHGHPTTSARFNRALANVPLSLWLPFERYRALHLAHHRDRFLTDPLEDPETQYFAADAWRALGPAGRLTVRLCRRLAGRLIVGPFWAIGRFLWRESGRLQGDQPGVRAAWRAHLPRLAAILAWLVVCRFNLLAYLLLFVWPGMSLLLLRSLVEHRAAPEQEHRTAAVERAPVFGLLFLFNNLHVAHHERPSLAWYRLPAFYRRERTRLITKNGGLVYAGYADVARRYAFRAPDQPVHPFG